MKKILFILHIPPPVHGSSVVGQYIKESDVINRSFDARYINLGTSRSVDEIGKNPLGKIGRYFLILWQVAVQLVKFQPDLCYLAITAKGSAFFKDALLALLVKLFRVRLVYHFHNKGVCTCEHRVLYNLCYQLVFRNSEAILLSQYLYPDIQKYFPENRVHYCPNGIPEERCQQTEHGRQPVVSTVEPRTEGGNLPTVLFLSNLIESKGVLVLLEACKVLHQQGILFHCTFVGGDADLTVDVCRKRAQDLGLEGFVSFVGKKYGADKEFAFSRADVFAFPTHYQKECFPLVLLEAMQHGLPVVSTFEGGIADIVEEGVSGYIIPIQSPDILAQKLSILLGNPELRKTFGAAGRMRYLEKYTLGTFENRMCRTLEQIINASK